MPADFLRQIVRRIPLLDAVTEIMHGLIIFSVLIILPYYFANEYQYMLLIWHAAAFVILWIARQSCSHIWQFLLISALIIASPFIPFFQLPLIPMLILLPGLIYLSIRSFSNRITGRTLNPSGMLASHGPVLLFLLGLNLLVLYFEMIPLSRVYFYVAIIYLLLAIFRYHTLSLSTQMSRFMTMPTQPAYRIKRFNQMMLAAFVLVMMIILIISPVFHLHDLVPWLGGLLLIAVRWLAQVLSRDEAPPPEPTPPAETQPDPGMENGLLPGAGEPPVWLVILQEIIYYTVMLAMVLLLIAAVVYGLISLYRRFYAVEKGPDVFESLLPTFGDDVREKIKRTRSRWAHQFGQSPDQKIRRIYWRVVDRLGQRGLKYNIKQSPRQFAIYVRHERDIDILDLTVLYEKARYGPGPCSAEDLQAMQSAYQTWRKNKKRGPDHEEGDYDR